MRKTEVPDLKELLERRKDEVKSDINCVSVGTINTFYPATQSADILINYKRILKGAEQKIVEYPMLLNCPVVVAKGEKGSLTFPIASGDECLVLFCDRDIDNWFEYDAKDGPPNSERVHDLSDGIAIVGMNSKRTSIADYKTDGVRLSYDTCIIDLDTKINLKVGLVTLRQALDALCTALLSWVDTSGDTPNGATIVLINTAQTLIDGVLK